MFSSLLPNAEREVRKNQGQICWCSVWREPVHHGRVGMVAHGSMVRETYYSFSQQTRGQKHRTRQDHTAGPERNMKACPPQWLKSSSQDPPAKGARAAPNSPLSLGPRVQTMADFLHLTLITPSLWPPTHFCKSVLSYQELQPGNRWSRQSCFLRSGRSDASGSFLRVVLFGLFWGFRSQCIDSLFITGRYTNKH